MKKDSKIYIAGHTGLVGSALYHRLKAGGYSNLIVRNHSDLDLTRQIEVEAFFQSEKPEYVFLAAAKVGGIMANYTYPAEFIYTNLTIQSNIIHSAWKTGVKRLLFLGSSCIYPKECPQPMKEEYLLTGSLEPTNEPYAVAKISGIKMCQAYNSQHGTHYLCVMPTNLYGPNDNFDLETSHVLAALIRKFHLAKLALQKDWEGIRKDAQAFGRIPDDIKEVIGIRTPFSGNPTPTANTRPMVPLWGSGNPRREFLHVDDLADACVFLSEFEEEDLSEIFKSDDTLLFNVGCGEDRTIKDIASIISEVVGFKAEVEWDQSKPDGTIQKLLDISRISRLGWKPSIDLKDGVRSVYEWYLKEIR
jgi:GDP-L-fucose synthase